MVSNICIRYIYCQNCQCCFPETVCQKKITNNYFNLGLLDWIAEIISNVLSPVNTFATNVLQCLDRGPRIIYTPLDFELKTTNPVERTTQPPAVVFQRELGK